MYTFNVSLQERKQISLETFEITFSINDNLDLLFSPGQYIWLILNNEFTLKDGERRAFSIVSSVRQKRSITILVKPSNSRYYKALFNMQLGSAALIIGPFGSSYVIKTDPSKSIVFIAGGVGISPFLSILRSRETYPNHKFVIVYCHSSADNYPFVEEIQKISKDNNFIFVSHNGRFEESILPEGINYEADDFYICGPKGLIENVNTVLTKRKVRVEQIHFEQNYPSKIQNLTEESFIQNAGENSILLRAIQDAKNHVIITDANGQIVFANNKAQSLTGFSFEEMRGNTPRLWGGMMPPEFFKKLWSDEVQRSGYIGELVNRNKDGRLYHVIAHISPIFSNDNNIIGFLGTEEDVTEKNQSLKQLEYQNKIVNLYKNRFGAIISNLGDGVVVVDTDKKISLMNQAAIELIGGGSNDYTQRDFISVCRFVTENNIYCLTTLGILNSIFKNTKIHAIKTNAFLIKADNSKISITFTANPFYDENGAVMGYVILFRDTTEEREVDKMKSEFVSIASHQLRTPLSGIQWITELLLKNKLGELNMQQKQFIEKIAEANKKLIVLVNDLLNVSRIDTPNKFVANKTSVNFVKFLNDLVEEEKIIGIPNRVDIVFKNHTNIDNIVINLDTDKIKQAFNNLIGNAIKYSKQADTVTVGIASVENNFVMLYFRDTGIGIPQKQKSRIFEKFFRADNASEIEGTGLGLYLVLSIIRLHNGVIWFDSVENEGTTFYIKLPLN